MCRSICQVRVLVLLLLSLSAQAKSVADSTAERAGLSPQRLSRIDHWVQNEIAAKHKSGVIVLISRHGKIAYQSVHGMADIAAAKPLHMDALFRLYSMTKPVTSVALLTLYEQGKFLLTDPLENYIPAFKDVKVYAGQDADGKMRLEAPKRKITIQDVLRHTAGFTYGVFGDTPVDRAYRAAGIDYAKMNSLKQMVDTIATMPLLYQPGEQWVYSFSHDVQAYLVEYFSGMSFDAYCRRTIFEPLHMNDTVFGVPPERAPRFAVNYGVAATGDGLTVTSGLIGVPASTEDSYARYAAHPFGGSGLSSTVVDYLAFSQMLLNGGSLNGVQILSPKTVELMTSNNLPRGVTTWSEGGGYGLGVEVVTNPAMNGGMGTAGRFGWGGYATTSFLVDPKEDMIAIMLTQYTPQDSHFVETFKTLVYQAIVDQRSSGSSPTSAANARR